MASISSNSGRNERRRPIRLHLGAFDCGISGWVNTDITPHIWMARIPLASTILYRLGVLSANRYQAYQDGRFRMLQYVNLTKPLPYSDSSCEAVFSSHVFEHLFLDEVQRLVREIWRVLGPGGVCRVIVPDLEKIVAGFDPTDPTQFINEIYEVGTRSAVKNSHHCGFTQASLTRLFREAGFSKTYKCSFGQGVCPDIDKLDNRPESIFFEAIK